MTTTVAPQDADTPEIASPDDVAPAETETGEPGPDGNPLRRAISVGLLCVGTAVVAGGLFTGTFTPRAVAVVTAALGCGLAFVVRRLRAPALVGVATVGGIAVIGLVGAVLVGGFGAIPDLGDLLSKALTQSDLLRPPIALTTGFAALVGWLMGGVSFGATWTAVVLQRPAFAMLVPLPIAAITAISAPRDQQIATGTILVAAFAAGIFLLSSDSDVMGTEGVPFRYELRRAVRAVPLIAVVVIGLVLLAQTDLLFPKPIINPALEAQKPKTIPISDTPDRVLFEVKSRVRGPWVMGVLDVYDGTDWRLPPFDEARLGEIDRSGVVSRAFRPGIKATITVKGLGGAVLPTLPNTVGVVAEGPKLNFDSRSGNIRLVEGEITEGFEYSLAGAATPNVKGLVAAEPPPSDLIRRFTEAPAPPRAAQTLIDEAPSSSNWARWDYLRRWVLDNITAAGAGSPVEIPSSRVDEILGSTKEASPFEIVAIQTLFARWVGVPARIGYGFDGGERSGDLLEVRPRDGAVFPQVYFEGNGWITVIGIPAKTKVTESSDVQQFQPGVLPSDDISVTIFRPVQRSVGSQLYERLRTIALIAVLALITLALLYVSLTPIRKSLRRARRRADATERGTKARIAQAYAEWRDLLTDFGYQHDTDTPLMLLKRFPPDEEHNQLAWLVTRALWGDLAWDDSVDIATDAEELARSMSRRLREAHPITVRAVATVSRLSLRSPYAVEVPHERSATTSERELHDVAV